MTCAHHGYCGVFCFLEWEPGYQERTKRRIKAKLGDALALRDFVRDVKLVLRSKRIGRYDGEITAKRSKVG
jgi:hypothetical protein